MIRGSADTHPTPCCPHGAKARVFVLGINIELMIVLVQPHFAVPLDAAFQRWYIWCREVMSPLTTCPVYVALAG
jgi:hypothetical protein